VDSETLQANALASMPALSHVTGAEPALAVQPKSATKASGTNLDPDERRLAFCGSASQNAADLI